MENLTLFIDPSDFYMHDSKEKEYTFHYFLALLFPEAELSSLIKDIEDDEELSLSRLQAIEAKGDSLLLRSYAEALFALGQGHHVLFVRSRDHRPFYEGGKASLKQRNALDEAEINGLWFNAYEAATKAFEVSPKSIITKKRPSMHVVWEEDELVSCRYDESLCKSLHPLTEIVVFFNNLSLRSSNHLIYGESKRLEFDQAVLEAWKQCVWPLFYDKFARVRDASSDIIHAILEDE